MFTRVEYPKVSVVICALNEEKNLPRVLPNIPSWVEEIILVDGHSTDQTVEIAKKLLPNVRILTQPNKGKGNAFKYGVLAAKNEIIVTFDADGTYLSEEISQFVTVLMAGYDFAKGSRFVGLKPDCMTRRRQIGNKILVWESNFLFGTKYTDICSGYYAFPKKVFNDANICSEGFELEQELFIKIAKMNLKVAEVPHSYRDRMYGSSKTMDFRQGFKDFMWILLFKLKCHK